MTARHGTRRHAHEDGFVAGGEMLIIGTLVFMFGMTLILNAWGLLDAKLTADATSREVTRMLVETDPSAPDLPTAANALAADVAAAHDVAADRIEVALPPLPDALERCRPLSVTVGIQVPTIRIPFVGGFGGDRTVSSTYTEVVDPLRAGLPGDGDCHA